jgi:hypothetical protein
MKLSKTIRVTVGDSSARAVDGPYQRKREHLVGPEARAAMSRTTFGFGAYCE